MNGTENRRGKPASFWVAVFLGLFLGGSLLLNFALLLSLVSSGLGGGSGASDGRYARRTLGGDRTAVETVGLLPIRGVIAEGSGYDDSALSRDSVGKVRGRLKAFREDANLKALLVEIDSPGGGITASDVIRREILAFKKEKGIPVVALMKDVAASGGYYVATACDKIVAHPTTITGSIGVIFSTLNLARLLDKIGVDDLTIISPKTPYKDTGSFARPMRDDERALLLGLVDEMYERFVAVVREGRPNLEEAAVRTLADGRIYSGTNAKALGLVDEVGYVEDALRACEDLAGIAAARLVALDPEPTFFESLLGVAGRARPPAPAEALGLGRALEPRLYYLWTGGALGAAAEGDR